MKHYIRQSLILLLCLLPLRAVAERLPGYALQTMLDVGHEWIELNEKPYNMRTASTMPLGTAMMVELSGQPATTREEGDYLFVQGDGRFILALGGSWSRVAAVRISIECYEGTEISKVMMGEATGGVFYESRTPAPDGVYQATDLGALNIACPTFDIQVRGEGFCIREVRIDEQFRNLYFSQDEFTATLGRDYQPTDFPLLGGDGLWNDLSGVAYESSHPDVARIDSRGNVVLIAPGTTTITAHVPAMNGWPAGDASYVLNVEMPQLPSQGSAERVTLARAGTLRLALADLESAEVGSLAIAGPLNSEDLIVIREARGRLAQLEELDLSAATLEPDGGLYATLKTAHSDIGSGSTTTNYYLNPAETRDYHSEPTGLGGIQTTIDYRTLSLGGLLAGNATLRRLILPRGMEQVGEFLARDCESLLQVEMPQEVEQVGESAFEGCVQLRSVGGIRPLTVGEWAFTGTQLAAIDLSRTLRMGQGAFAGTPLTEVCLSNLDEVPEWAFKSCDLLSQVEWSQSLTAILDDAFAGTAIRHLSLPASLVTLGGFADSRVETVEVGQALGALLPGSFNNTPWLLAQMQDTRQPVVYLGPIALCLNPSYQMPTSGELALREGTTVLADGFFGQYNFGPIRALSLPSTLRRIGDMPYGRYPTCLQALRQLSLPQGLEYIGNRAFARTQITQVDIPASVAHIGDEAFFNNKNLLRARVDATMADAGQSIFESCTALEKLTLGPAVERVPQSMCRGCANLLLLQMPDCPRLRTFDERCFESCTYLADFSFPEHTDSICASAFSDCAKLTALRLPRGLSHLGADVFWHCSALEELWLPAGITAINHGCIRYTDLRRLYIFTTELLSVGGFVNYNNSFVREMSQQLDVFLLPQCLEAYDAHPMWNCFRLYAMDEEHIAQSITTPAWQRAGEGQILDLQGRRLPAPPHRGLYIKDGRKYIRP